MKKNTIFWCLPVVLWLFAGCKKESKETIPEKVKITEATANDGLKAVLWADRSELAVGYNKIYISLSDATGVLEGHSATIYPVMDMGMMQHGCPVEQPVYDPQTNLYGAAVAFTMPSTPGSATWRLRIEVDDREVTLDIVVASAPANTKPLASFTGADDVSYFISLIQPASPKTGMNDLVILVNRQDGMFSFPGVDGLSIEFRPEMTSMGHSSPNNENPAGSGNGRYTGKVNYTMTGDWRLFFTLKKDGQTIITDTYLDILF